MATLILYDDNYAPLRSLSPERKAVLFDAIFLYSLGEELPEMDDLTRLAFGFLKNSIDHANDAAAEFKSKKSAAGKKGMATRWHSEDNNNENKNNNVTNVITTITPDNLRKEGRKETKEIKEGKGVITTLPDSNRLLPIDEVADWYITTAAFQSFAVANNLTRPRAEAQLKRFVTHLHAVGEDAKTRKDFMTHLQNWTKYNQPDAAKPTPPSAFANLEPL